MRNTWENYSQINVLYEYKVIVIDLTNNRSIINLQQNKGREAVIMNWWKWLEKYFDILNTEQFLNYQTLQLVLLK